MFRHLIGGRSAHAASRVILAAAVAGTLGLALQASAATVSVQFAGTGVGWQDALGLGDVAGVVPVANWNTMTNGYNFSYTAGTDAPITASQSGLVDSDGNPTSVGFSVTYNNGNNFGYGSATTGTAKQVLYNVLATMNGNNPASLTLTGLDPTASYEFIVYVSGSNSQVSYGSVGVTGGATYFFQSAQGDGGSGDYPTTFINQSSTTDMAPIVGQWSGEAYGSNYIDFTGVSGSDQQTLTLTQLGGWPYGSYSPSGPTAGAPLGFAGIQIISTATPEPASLGLLALGGLLVLSRRRRLA